MIKSFCLHILHTCDEGNKSWIETVFIHKWNSKIVISRYQISHSPVTFTKWKSNHSTHSMGLESNILKVLERVVEKYVLIFSWGLYIFKLPLPCNGIIFAVTTLKKTWECIPKSVRLKYKTAIWSFLLTLVLAKPLGEKRLAVNVFYLNMDGLGNKTPLKIFLINWANF